MSCGVLVFEYTVANKKQTPRYVKTGQQRVVSNRGRIAVTVQQLVAQTFLKKPKGYNVVVHKGYDKLYNGIDNLEWAKPNTRKGDRGNASNYKVPRNQGQKVNLNDVNTIREMLALKRSGNLHFTIKEIAERFGISDMHIYRIQNGDSWQHAGIPVKGKEKPSEQVAKEAGEWQSYDITLIGRMVTVVANGIMVICNQEIPGITGGALNSMEGEPGPLLLQGDHGPIEFRNITITPAL